MTKIVWAGLAGLVLALALAASAAAAPTVSVRVEGASGTLLPRTTVTPPDKVQPSTGCAADSAANALDTAVDGDWDGQTFVTTLLKETHDFSANDFWAFWAFRGGRYVVTNGICTEKLAAGEELLAGVQVLDAQFAPTVLPMWIEGVPATVAPGTPFTVTVAVAECETSDCLPGEGRRAVKPGATVTAGAVTATTDADGHATLTLPAAGPATLRATAPGALPTATESTCATAGNDGFCGTTVPPPPCRTTGDDGLCGTTDRRAPEATITGIREGQVFRRRAAPRTLTATVADDPSGILTVKLSLSRSNKGRCQLFSGKRGAFRNSRCGRHTPFVIGSDTDVSYLLPKRLASGRYVLDVIAIDKARNRDTLVRGRSRVVFTVR